MMSTSLSGSFSASLDVEHVDAGELLEQAALALHHRLAGQRADVAQAEHRRAIGDDRDQVATRSVACGLRAGRARSRRRLPPRRASRRATGRAASPWPWSGPRKSCPPSERGGTRARRHGGFQSWGGSPRCARDERSAVVPSARVRVSGGQAYGVGGGKQPAQVKSAVTRTPGCPGGRVGRRGSQTGAATKRAPRRPDCCSEAKSFRYWTLALLRRPSTYC